MSTEIKYRGGTAAEHTAFTGADREVTVNTTNKSLHVHDGSTANGFELARADLSNISAATFASLTAGVTMIFIRSADQPATPNPSSTTPTGWEANADNTTSDDPLWSSFGVKEAGETNFTWQTPVRTTGEAGADGTDGVDGATGATGADGARHAEIYMFYNTPQSSAPTAPTSGEVSYNFDTSVATVTASGWSVNFNPSLISSDNTANNKYWAVRVTFQEASVGGTVYATVTSAFTWLNFDGLVTFTNLSSGTNENGVGTTFIDGGSITANSITTSSLIADFIEVGGAASDINSGVTTIDGGKITTNTLSVSTITTGTKSLPDGSFGLGAGTSIQGVDVQVFGESSTNAQFGVGALNSATSGSDAHGLGALAASPDSFAFGGWNAPTAGGQTKWYCFGAGANTGLRCGQEPYTTGKNTTLLYAGTDDYGTLSQYKANGDTHPKSVAYTAFNVAAGVFRWRDGSTGSDLKSVNLCNATYAIEAVGGTSGTFTASHDALIPKTNTQPVAGDILVDTGVYVNKSINDTLCTNAISTSANQAGVIGVFSQYASDDHVPYAISIASGDVGRAVDPQYTDIGDYNFAVMNSVGEGMINVCGENGDIAIGDLIVTSSTAGKGMKQADDIIRSYTVAKAREAVTFANASEVKQIACIYLCG